MTIDDLRAHLIEQFHECQEECEFEREEAIYAFASSCHGGMGCDLYAVLSASEFRPGPMWSESKIGPMTRIYLHELHHKFNPWVS